MGFHLFISRMRQEAWCLSMCRHTKQIVSMNKLSSISFFASNHSTFIIFIYPPNACDPNYWGLSIGSLQSWVAERAQKPLWRNVESLRETAAMGWQKFWIQFIYKEKFLEYKIQTLCNLCFFLEIVLEWQKGCFF